MLLLDIDASDINAVEDTDYSMMGSTGVTLSSTDNSMTIEISIDPDMDVEETECFELVLVNTTEGNLDVCHTTTTICIKDDDTTSK